MKIIKRKKEVSLNYIVTSVETFLTRNETTTFSFFSLQLA